MRNTIIVLFFFLVVSGYGQAMRFHMQVNPEKPTKQYSDKIVDHWFGVDKGRHLVGSFILTGFSGLVLKRFARSGARQAQIHSFGFSISIGIGKELWDSTKKGNHFSYKDLTADVLGSLLAIFIIGAS